MIRIAKPVPPKFVDAVGRNSHAGTATIEVGCLKTGRSQAHRLDSLATTARDTFGINSLWSQARAISNTRTAQPIFSVRSHSRALAVASQLTNLGFSQTFVVPWTFPPKDYSWQIAGKSGPSSETSASIQ